MMLPYFLVCFPLQASKPSMERGDILVIMLPLVLSSSLPTEYMLHEQLLNGQIKNGYASIPIFSIPYACSNKTNNTDKESMNQYAFKRLIHLSMPCDCTISNLMKEMSSKNSEIIRCKYRKIKRIVCFCSSLGKKKTNVQQLAS